MSLKRSFQIFRDVNCMKSDEEEDNDLDVDIESIIFDSEEYEFIDSLNLVKMKKHIINCIASLYHVAEKEKERNTKAKSKEAKEKKTMIVVENKVFIAATTMIAQKLINGNGEQRMVIRKNLEALPDKRNISWNPLAWAVTAGNKITDDDIRRLYLADPMALGRHHLDIDDEECNHIVSYSPAHMLCMKTNPSLSLIRFLANHNPMPFSASCTSENDESKMYPLHLAAEYSDSCELLQILVQLDTSVTKKKGAFYHGTPHTPLGILCGRKQSPALMKMILCLIGVDNSVEVVEDAMCSLIDGFERVSDIQPGSTGHYRLTLMEMLLKANPEATKCENESIIHQIITCTKGDLFMSLMTLFLTVNEDALMCSDSDGNLPIHLAAKLCTLEVIDYLLEIYPESISETDDKGNLPIHLAAQYNTLPVIDYLLKIYPESASMINSSHWNILHCAMARNDKDSAEILTSILTQYPNLFHQRNNYGFTPLLLALSLRNFKAATAICQIDKQVIRDKVIYIETRPLTHLFTPLHIIIREIGSGNRGNFTPISEEADCLRLLISLHPEAAGIKNDNGLNPYDYAVQNQQSLYILRLLLRADPAINPEELRRLNYAERRQAMFLAFRAVTSNPELNIWRRLRNDDQSLLQHIVSFL